MEQAAHIGDAVVEIAQVATHPARIPALLCSFQLDLLNQKLGDTWARVFDVTAASGQSGIQIITVGRVLPTGNCDDPGISKKAIGVAQLALAWESYAQSDVELISSIDRFLSSFNTSPKGNGLGKPLIVAQQTDVLKESLSLVSQRAEIIQHECRHLKARADVQVSTVCLPIAPSSSD